ncbi:MAG TPA: BNR-4 repeat-containing protein, partial [Phycisphaeraceae bacterium]
YMLVNHTRGSNINRNLLLYSTDKARSWQVYALPHPYGFSEWAFFEVPDSQSRMTGPPTIRIFGGGFDGGSPITVIKPTKTASGGLSLGPATVAVNSSRARSGVLQAGQANATATVGDTTYLAYLSLDPIQGLAGTPQFIMSYNNITGQTISSPRLIGGGGSGAPDAHNAPAIAVDSKGYIHAILGAHHGRFEYTRSNQPNSIDAGFTPPTFIGKNPSSGGYTYISMVIDQDDTIHVVARYSGDNNRWALDYLRKKDGEPWEDLGHLVRTYHANYSTWDQRLTIDKLGRLFLRYSFYGDQLTDAEAAAYRAKWPDEEISRISGSSYWNGIQHHDPVILMSDDGGDTWRIATTEDFLAGIVPEPACLIVWVGGVLLAGRRLRRCDAGRL